MTPEDPETFVKSPKDLGKKYWFCISQLHRFIASLPIQTRNELRRLSKKKCFLSTSHFCQNFPGRTSEQKLGSLLNADVLSPSAPAPSLIALLLYGWTERLAVLPTKCVGVVAAVHAAAGREERRMASSKCAFSAWHCTLPQQRGCHQVGVRRLSPPRAPSVAVRQPHTSQHSSSSPSGKWPECFLNWIQWQSDSWVGEEEHGRTAEARRGRGNNNALAHGEIHHSYASLQFKGRT